MLKYGDYNLNFLDRTDRSVVSLWWWTVDHKLLGLLLVLIVGGIMLLMSAGSPVAISMELNQNYFLKKQILFLSASIPLMILISILRVSQIRRICMALLLLCFFSMIYINIYGTETNGATRWLKIYGFSIQPSEFIKPCFVVVNAWFLSLWINERSSKGWVISTCLLISILTILLSQPDVGMSFILTATWIFQIYIAGISMFLVLAIASFASFLGISSYFLLDHVQYRVDNFLDGGGFQVGKSIDAFLNGGMFGQGFGESSVSEHLPDSHTDFIFAVAGEELGIFGCGLIILAYLLIFLRGMVLSSASNKIYLVLTCSALIFQFCLQAIVHMASTLNLIPTKGMTLPFISYGGSSLIASSITMGIVLAMTRRQTIKDYE